MAVNFPSNPVHGSTHDYKGVRYSFIAKNGAGAAISPGFWSITTPGTVGIATSTEVDAGTVGNKYVTARGLKDSTYVQEAALGTAAAANVQTSATDTAIDAVMLRGSWGLGGSSIIVTDYNTIVKSGMYSGNAANNGPDPTGNFLVLHMAAGDYTLDNQYSSQMAIERDGRNRTFTRWASGASWSAWREAGSRLYSNFNVINGADSTCFSIDADSGAVQATGRVFVSPPQGTAIAATAVGADQIDAMHIDLKNTHGYSSALTMVVSSDAQRGLMLFKRGDGVPRFTVNGSGLATSQADVATISSADSKALITKEYLQSLDLGAPTSGTMTNFGGVQGVIKVVVANGVSTMSGFVSHTPLASGSSITIGNLPAWATPSAASTHVVVTRSATGGESTMSTVSTTSSGLLTLKIEGAGVGGAHNFTYVSGSYVL